MAPVRIARTRADRPRPRRIAQPAQGRRDPTLWAQLAPRSCYDTFPLPGHRWIASSGAFNEHLVRDVGGLYLAMTVVSVWAALGLLLLAPAEQTQRMDAKPRRARTESMR